MSDAYTKEIQADDLAAIDAAQKILSAMVVGEHPVDLKPNMATYARIAGYNEGSYRRTVARVFWALCQHNEIDGFQLNAYEIILNAQRKLVKSKLIRRKRVPKTCLQPLVHIQRCYCGNLVKET
jgi:hypothetical protein